MWKLRTLLLPALLLLPGPLFAQQVVRLEIYPAERILHAPHNTQQLAVIAHFTDSTNRDVTRLTSFSSSDGTIASVNLKGQVRFHVAGEIAVYCRYQNVQTVRLTYVEPKPGFVWPNPPVTNLIDHLVFEKLKLLCIAPSELCTDVVFLRRAYLDVCGILPTPREVRNFMDDTRSNKRSLLIDELLARPEFAECWAHHWVETLDMDNWRIHEKRGAALLHWFRGNLHGNVPLDRVVRDLLVGKGVVTDLGPTHYYHGGRNAGDYGDLTAQAFLGVRLRCVQCHSHPKARWTTEDRHHFAAFFSQLYRTRIDKNPVSEMVLLDRTGQWLHPEKKKPVPPRFLDGERPRMQPDQDRRQALADWLTSPKNPYFARTMVNRIWYHLLQKGIAHPPEAIHELPFSANDPLLDVLAKEFVSQRFDVKQMIRIIMNSRTYQLSAETNKFNENDGKYFSRAYRSQLKTEVLLDALTQVTETTVPYGSMPLGTRAVSTLHPDMRFLDVFSRPARTIGCEAEASNGRHSSALHMIHSSELTARLEDRNNRIGRLFAQKKTDREMLDELFLAAFARLPRDREYEVGLRHIEKAPSRRRAWEDVLYAVINTKEFMCRP